jgi:hypothetical protein
MPKQGCCPYIKVPIGVIVYNRPTQHLYYVKWHKCDLPKLLTNLRRIIMDYAELQRIKKGDSYKILESPR